jgi:esterase/lipase superfamily enzyme
MVRQILKKCRIFASNNKSMAQIRKVFHVEFREPIDGKKHYYFGSKTAIFQRFTAKQMGITYQSFRNVGNIKDVPYINKWCVVRQGELIASQSNKEEE